MEKLKGREYFCKLLSADLAAMVADAIQAYSGGELTVTGPTATAGIFCTYPADYLSTWGGIADQVVFTPTHPPPRHFINVPDAWIWRDPVFGLPWYQVIGTAALLLCVLALGDQRNTPLPDALQPVLGGATVLVIGISMGSNSGYAINPARDIGPRLFTYFLGWGADVFTSVASEWPLWLAHD